MGKRITRESFISRSKLIYGETYIDYRFVMDDVANKHKVDLLCNQCKQIWSPKVSRHLFGRGQKCPVCSNRKTLTRDEVIIRSRAIHGDSTYDYSNAMVKNNRSKIELKCNRCDTVWYPTVTAHVNMHSGCPKCAKSGYKSHLPAKFYIYKLPTGYGFGISNSFNKRDTVHRRTFKTSNVVAELLHVEPLSGVRAFQLETKLKFVISCKGNSNISGFLTECVALEELNTMREILADFGVYF